MLSSALIDVKPNATVFNDERDNAALMDKILALANRKDSRTSRRQYVANLGYGLAQKEHLARTEWLCVNPADSYCSVV